MPPPRTKRPGFSRRAQYSLFAAYMLAVGGALIGAVLLVISTLNPPLFSALRSGVSELTTPVATGLSSVRRPILDLPGGFGQYFGVVEDNRRMRARIAAEREVVMRARTLSIENQRLRRLLELRDAAVTSVTTARLVNSSASSTRRYATLNAGRFQGVHPGQPVRGAEGLVGRVLETGPNTARILLLTDPESIVPIKRTRDGLPAIASGRGDGLVDIRSANIADVEFRVGDAFVTSGSGGIYPPGVPVARIVTRARDVAPARLFANPDALDFALVQQPFLPSPPPPPQAEQP